MISKNIPTIGDQTFEELKQSNEHDAEYWSARDLQPLLGYSQWRRFEDAINRPTTSCEQSGNNPAHHFTGAGKPIKVPVPPLAEQQKLVAEIKVLERTIAAAQAVIAAAPARKQAVMQRYL